MIYFKVKGKYSPLFQWDGFIRLRSSVLETHALVSSLPVCALPRASPFISLDTYLILCIRKRLELDDVAFKR